jgi:CRP/FNR family transcriptional regulator
MEVPNIDCAACGVSGCFVKRSSSAGALQQISRVKKTLKRKSGQALIYSGMPWNSICFIYQGKCKVVADGLFGKQQIKRLSKAGDILGLRELEGDHIAPSSVYAIEDLYVCSVERETFVQILLANPEMMLETLMFVTKELRQSEWRMKNLTLMNVREKIAYSLLYIQEVFGDLPGGEIDVKLTREEISEVACTSKELVSRTLSEFEKEGFLATEGKKIFLINKAELMDIIGVNEEVSFA